MSVIASANVMPVLLTTLYQQNLESGASIDPLPGTVGALLSPENKQYGEAIQNVNAMGQVTSLRVSYKQPFEADDFSEDFTCGEDSTVNPWLEETFQPDSYIEHLFKIEESRLRTYMAYWSEIVKLIPGFAQMGPMGVQVAMNGLIQRGVATAAFEGLRELGLDLKNEFRAFVDKYNQVLLPMLEAGAGAWKGGAAGASVAYTIQNAASYATGGGSAAADGIFALQENIQKLRRRGNPHIVHDYGAYNRIASRNPNNFSGSQQGINFSTVALLGDFFRGYLDEFAADTLGANKAVIISPGAALLAQAPQYKMFGKIGIVERLTIDIPSVPGLTADVTVTPVACDAETNQGAYVIKLSANFGLWTAPLDMFKASSPFYQTNGIVIAELLQA